MADSECFGHCLTGLRVGIGGGGDFKTGDGGTSRKVDTIRDAAKAKTQGFKGSLQTRMTDYHLALITAARHSTPVLSFEDWKANLAA